MRRFWGYLRAFGWRLGWNRPTQFGSYVRYTGTPDVEAISAKELRYLRRLCRIADMRIMQEREFRLRPNPDHADPLSVIGSVGWKLDVL